MSLVSSPVTAAVQFERERLRLRRQRRVSDRTVIEHDWHTWLTGLFPEYVSSGFAPYHEAYWRWVWSIDADQDVPPFVAIWPRGFGKSTSTEAACAMLAARRTRRYALYVCETQEQSDDHVANVAGMLESGIFATFYPETASRKIGKYGNSQGWRRNRLRTASGFTLDAIGLDTAARGVKLDEDRPDLLIFDDIDGKLDTAATTQKKITTMTHSLIPAGAATSAVLAVQNLVIPDGVFAQLADGRAEFLADRIVSGPHPAIANMVTEQRDGKTVITDGDPTWTARPLPVLQAELNRIGLTAFLAEKQHDVEAPAGGMFDHLDFRHCTWNAMPDLVRVAVWVDPAVTNTDQSDSMGIQADGIAGDGTLYRLYSWEQRTSPEDALKRAILKAVELGALEVGVETDQGGDTWRSVYARAVDALVADGRVARQRAPRFTSAKAGAGYGPKVERASKMLAAYERGQVVHVVGTHETLERALNRFPKIKPFDLVDACIIAGMLVTTDHGEIPIEHVEPGMMALTRQGLRPVVAAGPTQESVQVVTATFADGRVLTGTKNHPVWTTEQGWTPLGDLAGLHGILLPCTISSIQSKPDITGESIADTLTRSSARIAFTMLQRGVARVVPKRFTGKSGPTTLDRFQKVTTSITPMVIRSITIPTIFAASPFSSIAQPMPGRTLVPRRKAGSILRVFVTRLLNGIARLKGACGIANRESDHGGAARNTPIAVNSAVSDFRVGTRLGQCFVQRAAAMPPLSRILAILRTTRAKDVERAFVRPNTGDDAFAQSRVEIVTPHGHAAVYNLSVDETPEYFANGVLVHNCYWSWWDLSRPVTDVKGVYATWA